MLGCSLTKLSSSLEGVTVNVFFENKEGLPTIYNKAIRSHINKPRILVFVHDDVFIYDVLFKDRVIEEMKHTDVAGVAGTTVRYPKQPNWYFKFYDPERNEFEVTDIWAKSGVIAHGDSNSFIVSRFGALTDKAKLLDGVMLIAKSSTLIENNLYFDERFRFDMYDMDFCRQVEDRKLRMSTIGLSLIHASSGKFDKESWRSSYDLYIAKWGS